MHYVLEGNKEEAQEEEANADTTAEYERLQTLTASIDTNKLAQVIRNLISNALKFTPRGGAVRVRLYRSSIQHQQHSTDCISMDVVDSGPGISIVRPTLLHYMSYDSIV